MIKLINEQLKNNISVKNVSVNELMIELDIIVNKKVPVITKTDITFQDGFKAVGAIRVEPDSVLISGPSQVINEISRNRYFSIKSLVDNNVIKIGLEIKCQECNKK